MSDKLVRIATFAAGLVVGAAMVYLSPPPVDDTGPVGPPLDGSAVGPTPGQIGGPDSHVGGGDQGSAERGGPPLPGSDGAVGAVPHVDGTPGGQGPPLGEGPPTGEGALPSEGPPPGEGAPPSEGAGGVNGPPAGGAWLEDHLADAEGMWTDLAVVADSQGHVELASSMRELAGRAPVVGERPPPLDQVVVFLSDERVMVDRLRAAGVDVSRVERAIGPILR